MSNRWHIGAKQLKGALASYAKRFDLLEVKVALEGGDEAGAVAALTPGLATLRRWRKAVPPHFHFSVVAGPHLSRVRPSPEADRELEGARAAIDALQARCFVLRTPPEVTPTALWRDRIGKIIERLPHDVTHFVWEPSGVWEIQDATARARAWGIVLAVDPTRELVPPGTVAYLRFRALGETYSFGTAALDRVVAAVGAHREVFTILETDSALQEAKALRQLARTPRATAGGGGRLVRPRGAIVVSDDEQE
jgi:uncharacterized protein YecE (DUF72 family)